MIRTPKFNIPLSGAQADWGNPLTQAMCFLTLANARAGHRIADIGPSASHGFMTAMDPSTDWEAGKFGTSVNFDGSTTQEVTYTSTANISDVGNDQSGGSWMFVGRRNATDDGPFFYKSDNDGTRGYACWIRAADGIHFYCPLSGGGIAAVSSNFPAAGDDFVLHVTWTGAFAGTAIRLFLNGVECTYTSQTGSGSAHNSDLAYDLRIGDGGAPGPSKWNGKFYGMAVWRRVLSDAEIRTLGIWPWQVVRSSSLVPYVASGGPPPSFIPRRTLMGVGV